MTFDSRVPAYEAVGEVTVEKNKRVNRTPAKCWPPSKRTRTIFPFSAQD